MGIDFGVAMANHREELGVARNKIKRSEQQSALVDAAGLPLIGIGIVLLGLPDRVVGHKWVSGPLLLIAGIAVAVSVFTFIQGRQLDRKDTAELGAGRYSSHGLRDPP